MKIPARSFFSFVTWKNKASPVYNEKLLISAPSVNTPAIRKTNSCDIDCKSYSQTEMPLDSNDLVHEGARRFGTCGTYQQTLDPHLYVWWIMNYFSNVQTSDTTCVRLNSNTLTKDTLRLSVIQATLKRVKKKCLSNNVHPCKSSLHVFDGCDRLKTGNP